MKIIPIIALCIACIIFTADAGDVLVFPASGKALSAETMPYTQMLHTGTERDTFYMRGRFGVDFPVIGYEFGSGNRTVNIGNEINSTGNNGNGGNLDGNGGNYGNNRNQNSRNYQNNGDENSRNYGNNRNQNSRNYQNNTYENSGDDSRPKILLGISAAAHINMRPTSGMLFPVDNFYAVLAVYFSGVVNSALSWRFYPVHHVSAHLADGASDYIKENGVRAVSSEMTRGEVYWKPFGDIVEFGAGGGYYYHVCAQENLRYRADISILLTPPINILDGKIKPYLLALAENVRYGGYALRYENFRQGGNKSGIDVSAGVMSLNDKRGFGLSLRYFNKIHSSYYFEQYEKGWGAEYTFVY